MSSLFTALSGLQAHQQWIDVLGNNLANSNTPGFKTSRVSFSDHFSRTLQFASGPGVSTGGRNPTQIGNGVRLADIGRNFSQGALTNTGRRFDLAIQGRGFFTLSGNGGNLYTRVGTFGLDSTRNLVDVRSGLRVVGTNGQPITIDADSLFPPQATANMSFKGNLPAVVSGPLPEVLQGQTAMVEGANATLASTGTGPFTVPVGETWTLEVQVNGGVVQTASVTSTTGTVTATEIATAIDLLDDVSSAVNGTGQIEVLTDRKGANVSLKINPGSAGQDLASLTGLSTVLTTGSEIPLSPTTTLNDLPGNVIPYVAGDVIQISGVDNDGSAINTTFTYGAANDGETVNDFVAFLNGLYTDASVTLLPDGRLELAASSAGESGLTLSIIDDASGAGQTSWSTYALSVTTQGTGPDEVTSSMEVFDQAGVPHTVTFTLQRQGDATWSIIPSIPASDGTVQSGTISGLQFNPDGSPTGISNLNLDVTITFNGQPTQTLTLGFGADGMFDGVTQFGGAGNVFVSEQDGYAVGELSSINVEGNAEIQGFYTNGQTQVLGALGVAVFTNPEGLRIGGALENSNVDTAEQFVRLIEAQRGFQANARVITTQDELLAEMVNLI